MRGLEGNMQAEPRIFAHDAIPLNFSVAAGASFGFAKTIERATNTGTGFVAGNTYTSVANSVELLVISVDSEGKMTEWKIINPGTANTVPSVLTFNGPTAGTTTFNVIELGIPSTDERGACIYVGKTGANGTLVVKMESGQVRTFTGVAAGSFLPILVSNVLRQGTDATGATTTTDVDDVLALF